MSREITLADAGRLVAEYDGLVHAGHVQESNAELMLHALREVFGSAPVSAEPDLPGIIRTRLTWLKDKRREDALTGEDVDELFDLLGRAAPVSAEPEPASEQDWTPDGPNCRQCGRHDYLLHYANPELMGEWSRCNEQGCPLNRPPPARSKEWWLSKAQLEEGCEVGAGAPASEPEIARDVLTYEERAEVEHWRTCHATSTRIAVPTLLAIIDRLVPRVKELEIKAAEPTGVLMETVQAHARAREKAERRVRELETANKRWKQRVDDLEQQLGDALETFERSDAARVASLGETHRRLIDLEATVERVRGLMETWRTQRNEDGGRVYGVPYQFAAEQVESALTGRYAALNGGAK